MSSFEKYQNNRLFILGGRLADIMILSLMWLACSLPVVTMGASTSALYFSTVKCLREQSETSPAKCFWRSFKGCLRQGIAAWLIYLVYGALVAADIYAAVHGIGDLKLPKFYRTLAYALVLPIAFTLPYIFPCIGRFENDLKSIFKNSFLLSASHLAHTIGILATIAAGLFVMVVFPPLALVVPALCALLSSLMIEPDFEQALGSNTEDEPQALNESDDESTDEPADNDTDDTDDTDESDESFDAEAFISSDDFIGRY